jgi:GTP-binding protein
MFDRVEIKVKAGDGGDGAIGFHREKFVPFGGPDGGDGGNGGGVVIRADGSLSSLSKFRHHRSFRAGNGSGGGGNRRHGGNGEDMVISVPAGTVVSLREADDSVMLLADLAHGGDEVTVASGGRGGWGNTHFSSSTNQVPRVAQRGETGEEHRLMLEMRLIADVGIIGFPNAGKSTLLGAASAARPKVADYPFTTLEPVLGVIEVGPERFVMAEIPGLIEGAHLGKGLGHDFLRHILRTRVLVHLLDGGSVSPADDMMRVNEELAAFDAALAAKPQVVAVNKIDRPDVRARLDDIKKELKGAGVRARCVSAAAGEGVTELMAAAGEELKAAVPAAAGPAVKPKVFRPRPRDGGVDVRREGDVFVLTAPGLERLKFGDKVSPSEAGWQLRNHLGKMGARRALEKAGVKPGDRIRCGNLEWEW